MPIIPSVFQPIKANDYQQRPIKAYKRYKVNSSEYTNASGYFRHNAVYRKHTPHITADDGDGIGTLIYPVNTDDQTNQHVVWNVIDHKYYRNYNPAQSADFKDIDAESRFLWQSASVFTAPYGQVGERIMHGSVIMTSSIADTPIHLRDDGNGNLRDPLIDTGSFASSSRNFFHMSFNNLYRKFNDYDELGNFTGGSEYKLNSVHKTAIATGPIIIVPGITTSDIEEDSGLAAKFSGTDYIRIPHNDKFDRFGKCDDWTISFWHCTDNTAIEADKDLITKYAIRSEAYLDSRDGKRKSRDVITSRASIRTEDGFKKIRTPFAIGCDRAGNFDKYYFQSSDGSNALQITSSQTPTLNNVWNHVLIRNSASLCQMFINGDSAGTTSGSLPVGIVANAADMIIGSADSKKTLPPGADFEIAEIRMYDYAVNQTAINSLGNRHYISASCYQTNVVGNVFYKNGQIVASSHLPKYNSGSGIFGNTWEVEYRGTHTLYENECLVRIPKDQFNVTMNPTSTYRPITDGEPCDATQENLPPGELRKGLFVSGTLKPYITTIGLYNDKAEMLATAKLAQPIQKNPDVDMNLVLRWDY